MEFIFQISDFSDPALEAETVELLRQRLEVQSRRLMPGMWKVTDHLNAYAAKGPGRESRRMRYRIWSVILLILGIVALVPGLTEPKNPALIMAGIFGILIGLLNFCMTLKKKPAEPPLSCRQGAAALLAERRAMDWEALRAEVCFDGDGWSVTTTEGESRTTYDKLRDVFETERLWMLVDAKDMAVLLQKKDLISGTAKDFLPYLQGKINSTLSYKGEST